MGGEEEVRKKDKEREEDGRMKESTERNGERERERE